MGECVDRVQVHYNEVVGAKSKRVPMWKNITPNNKTGLFPKCQKGANGIVAEIGLTGIII